MALPTGHTHKDAVLFCLGIFLVASCWGGIDAGNTRRLYTMAPERNQSLYLVLYTLTASMALSIGAFLGGVIVKVVRAYAVEPGATGWGNALDYRVLFLCAAALIVLGIGYSRRMLAMDEIPTARLMIFLRLRMQRWLMTDMPGTIVRTIARKGEEAEGEDEPPPS